MVFDYEADCSYNTKMLPLPYTSNCGERSRDFGTQAVRGGLCAAVTLPFCSLARIGIIPHSLLNQGLSLLFPTPPPRPVSFVPTQRLFLLLSKQPSAVAMSCTTLPFVLEAGPCPARIRGGEDQWYPHNRCRPESQLCFATRAHPSSGAKAEPRPLSMLSQCPKRRP